MELDNNAVAKLLRISNEDAQLAIFLKKVKDGVSNNYFSITSDELWKLQIFETHTNLESKFLSLFPDNQQAKSLASVMSIFAQSMGYTLGKEAIFQAYRTLFDVENPIRLPLFCLLVRETVDTYLLKQAPSKEVKSAWWYSPIHYKSEKNIPKQKPTEADQIMYSVIENFDLNNIGLRFDFDTIYDHIRTVTNLKVLDNHTHFTEENTAYQPEKVFEIAVDIMDRAHSLIAMRHSVASQLGVVFLSTFKHELHDALKACDILRGANQVTSVSTYFGSSGEIYLMGSKTLGAFSTEGFIAKGTMTKHELKLVDGLASSKEYEPEEETLSLSS